ncbi:dTMP kinase [Myxococcaceae bacterium GXIMD 01537]
MLIVFEGIDGSGKTTLSNRVAEVLRQGGLRVRHVREGGQLASPVSESLRRFTRDPANLALVPMTELLLYAAREAQLLEEVTRPALAHYDVVITDRYF